MRVLLDTHVFLWWNLNDSRLSADARRIIADGGNTLYLSAATAWEIAIKAAKGRLELPEPADRYVSSRLTYYHFTPLPIELSHALEVYNLPPHHNDPFDRLLVAQAMLERVPILSADAALAAYEVETIW